MGRKIKRSKNPKTLAKYQIQIDAWIAELEEEARAAEYAGRPKKEPGAPESPGSNESKKIAVKIAEKAGPRKCYNYFEFERSHFRRSRF